ncbi:MAG: hypothetical protein CVT75_06775 [Alphaproteobacteria bacterium HGW-Alphaproteobacteria-14]|nr:MAG: hypothetical protein CVT75_06775 [Alphaproteobacteria bacterium HGW-Alphaproteobacteria-14]
MTMIYPAGLAAFLLLAPGTVPTMTEDSHALTLDVQQHDGAIEVRLIGNTAHTQVVSYLIEVRGQSTSRHRGRTTLSAGNTAVLSTMRASVGADWCVKLVAEESGREPYEIIEGSCAAPAE